jgi:hypothetical protein
MARLTFGSPQKPDYFTYALPQAWGSFGPSLSGRTTGRILDHDGQQFNIDAMQLVGWSQLEARWRQAEGGGGRWRQVEAGGGRWRQVEVGATRVD